MTREELLDLGFTEEQLSNLAAKYADLQIQSMLFDMDIDIETMTLVRKNDHVLSSIEQAERLLATGDYPADHWLRTQASLDTYKPKPWLNKWLEQAEQGDNQAEYNVDLE